MRWTELGESTPIMRMLEFPADPGSRQIEDEFLIGDRRCWPQPCCARGRRAAASYLPPAPGSTSGLVDSTAAERTAEPWGILSRPMCTHAASGCCALRSARPGCEPRGKGGSLPCSWQAHTSKVARRRPRLTESGCGRDSDEATRQLHSGATAGAKVCLREEY